MRPLLKACVLLIAIIWIAGPSGTAQVKVPKPPETYDVHLRFRIQADRNERVLQFEAMTKYFGSIGFKEAESDEGDLAPFDPNAEMMSGTIPACAKARSTPMCAHPRAAPPPSAKPIRFLAI